MARKISRKITKYPNISFWPWHFPPRPKLSCNYNTVHTDPEGHTVPLYSILFQSVENDIKTDICASLPVILFMYKTSSFGGTFLYFVSFPFRSYCVTPEAQSKRQQKSKNLNSCELMLRKPQKALDSLYPQRKTQPVSCCMYTCFFIPNKHSRTSPTLCGGSNAQQKPPLYCWILILMFKS